jgi:hypothetical protein
LPGTATRLLRPADCVLASAVPLTRTAFEADRADGSGMEFARQAATWGQYRHEIVDPWEAVAPRVAARGARVVSGATASDITALLLDESVQVMILMAHSVGDGLELRGGPMTAEELVHAIPARFTGILDLCACRPLRLAEVLDARRPQVLVKLIPRQATPAVWLFLYLLVFEILSRSSITYVEALERGIDLLAPPAGSSAKKGRGK